MLAEVLNHLPSLRNDSVASVTGVWGFAVAAPADSHAHCSGIITGIDTGGFDRSLHEFRAWTHVALPPL